MENLNTKTAIDEYFNAKLKELNLRKKVKLNLNLYSALTLLDGVLALTIQEDVPEDHKKVYVRLSIQMLKSLQEIEPKLAGFLQHIQTEWKHYKDEIKNSNLSKD